MRKTITLVAILAIALLTSCGTATANLPQLPETAKSVCHLYQNAKPKVVALREWAKANWNATVPGTDVAVIPAEVKATLTEFDTYLPQIDAAGKLICGFADSVDVVSPGGGAGAAIREKLKDVPWDKVLSATIKAVDIAVQYQQKKG